MLLLEILNSIWCLNKMYPIEHSENKIITQYGMFENEIGPGVVHATFDKNECGKKTRGKNHVQLIMSVLSEIVADFMVVE